MKIDEKSIKEITGHVNSLTRLYRLQIEDAFNKFGSDPFKITYTSTLGPSKKGGIEISTEIKFRPEPDVKDKMSGNVDEDQMELFEDKKVIPFKPKDRRGPVGNPQYKLYGNISRL